MTTIAELRLQDMGRPLGQRMRRSRKTVLRIAIGATAAGLVAASAGAAYVSVIGYREWADFFSVQAKCGAEPDNIQQPTSFSASIEVDGVRHDVDSAPYRMPAPETVSLAARDDPGVTIAAWWEPAILPDGQPAGLDAPTVIVTHGTNGCRHNSGNLLAAGMLHRHGIAVLLIDMRNHGDSTITDGRYAGGTAEYRDVLGAFDWLRARGVPAGRIGLFGFSGGAIASMIAMGEESSIAAIFADSSWTTAGEVIRDGLAAGGYPTFLDSGVLLVGRLHGVDLATKSPLAAAARLGARPAFLVQGARDGLENPLYLGELADAIQRDGGSVETWQAANAGHTQAHFLYPAEYETRLATFFGRALGASLAGI